jgi:N-methylhydantoinase A
LRSKAGRSAAGARVGVDVGGTFTDLIARDAAGRFSELKVPTTPENPSIGVLEGVSRLGLAGERRLAAMAHGTTAVTNAIVEGRIAPVGLVTTRGFRDVLEIARQNRTNLYDNLPPNKPEPLVPRRLRLEVGERVAADGSVLEPLDLDGLVAVVGRLRAEEIRAVAVCLLHAYANPAHERALAAALAPHFPYLSISSEVNAEFREYERTTTTVLNAAVMPLAARYVDELVSRLGAVPLHLLHSAGGMMSAEQAKARPLAMAMSGPAAGVAAAAWVASRLRIDRALAFDMGGTTTDVCLIADGRAETTSQRRLGGQPVRLPMVAVESIGAGGGSIAFRDAAGALKVGPRSAGAVPGPACYGTGGEEPTVTDANVVLGYLNTDRLYGGSIRLDTESAQTVVSELGKRFGLSLIDAAQGIVDVANSNMLRALRLVSVQRGYDLRRFTLVAYGGAGPIHAGALARLAGVARIVVPAHSGAFSALGCLVSPLRYDAVQTYRARLDQFDPKPLDDRFRELVAHCTHPLEAEGIPLSRITVAPSVDLRYVGQNYELEVPYHRDPSKLKRAFEARHRQLYGYATGEGVECVNARVVAMVASRETVPAVTRAASKPEVTGAQRAYFRETGLVTMKRYARATVGSRAIAGPALIEDDWSTTIVAPGERCTRTPTGDLVIEVGR